MKRISFFYAISFLSIIGLLFASASYAAKGEELLALSIAAAQEAQEAVDVGQKITLDEDFAPEDFGLTGVGILPTSPFYFLKGIRRTVQSAFTFDPVAEAELKIRFSAEKLLETKAVAGKEGATPNDITFALENFQGELQRVSDRIKDASDGLEEGKAVELTKKLMDSTMKYQKSLGKIEKTLPPELFENMKLAKEKTSETFGSAFDLVEPEKVTKELVGVLETQKGSEFKDFKNIEILKEIEEKVPEQAKDAVRVAQEQALTRLQGELEKLQLAKRAVFEDFVREIGGSEARQLEIITDLGMLPLSADLREVLASVKEEALSKTDRRLQTLTQPQQEKFLEHLAQGEIKNVKVLKELENNVSKGVLQGIRQAKERAKGGFVEKVKGGEFQEKGKQELFGELERSHDAGSLAVLDEIEALIPSDKKAFFSDLKQKAVVEIKRDIDRAGTASQRQVIFAALAGDHPEQFRAIDRFQKDVDVPFDFGSIWEGLRKAQVERFEMRTEFIKDKDRLTRLEEDVGKQKEEFKEFRKFEDLFRTRRNVFDSPERAQAQIREAEARIAELERLVDSLPFDAAREEEGGFDHELQEIERLLEVAEQKLEAARDWISREPGRAFGFANAASGIARHGIQMAQEYKSGRKVVRCPFFFPPPPNFCQNGRMVSDIDQNGCQLPPRCEFVERCPFPPPIPFNFCSNGRIVYEKSPQGCPLPPRCEEFRTCPLIVDPKPCSEGSYRDGFYRDGCFVYGECRPAEKEKPITCQAYWSGFVYRPETNSCVKEGTSACSDPFVFHTQEECDKANKITICPAMPTVTDCPAGQRKTITFSSPQCGTFYSCEPDQPSGKPQCADGIDNDNDGFIDYPKDTGCYGADDTTETPYVGGSCLSYATQTSCQSSGCTWYTNHHDGTHCDDAAHGGGTTTFTCNNNKICEGNENYQSCPGDCGGGAFTCNNNKVCETNENYTSCPGDCGGAISPPGGGNCSSITSDAICKTTSGCQWNVPLASVGSAYCSMVYAGDTSSCPGFSYSKWDSTGARYCQLNNIVACEFFYPAYLDINNYYPSECPKSTAPSPSTSVPSPGPSGLRFDLGGVSVVFNWTDNSFEDSNKIEERMMGGTTWSIIGSIGPVGGGTGSYAYPNRSPGSYDYRVMACNTAGCSTPSNSVTVTYVASTTSTVCTSPAGCKTSADCAKAGYYWCTVDSQCYSTSTTCPSSTTTKPQCSDGIDNDTDGLIDYPADTGCYGSDDTTETAYAPTGCMSYTSSTSCQSAACTWYANHYDGSHCDDVAHGGGTTTFTCDNDKICESNENYTSCPGDCGGSTASSCNNNGVCDGSETAAMCPADCGTTTTIFCGDHMCNGSETSATCPVDCSTTTTTTCASGYYWDSATNSCKTTSTTDCPSGQYWDTATMTCKTSTTGASLFTPFLKLFGF